MKKVLEIWLSLIVCFWLTVPLWGSAIENTAAVEGYLLPSQSLITDSSNTVFTDFVRFERLPDSSTISVDINDTGYLFFALRNTGSLADSYTLSAEHLATLNIKWLFDSGSVGIIDGSEYEIETTPTLVQGESIPLILEIFAKIGNNVGDIIPISDSIASFSYPAYFNVYLDTIIITGDGTPPLIPYITNPVSGTYTPDSQPLITWTASSDTGVGLKGYLLEISSDSHFSSLMEIDTLPASETSIVLSTYLNEGKYFIRVQAFDTNLNFSDYDTSWFYVDYTAPGTPIFDALANTYTADAYIVLSGTVDSDVVSATTNYSSTFNKISDTRFQLYVTNLTPGTNAVILSVADSAGNWSPTSSVTVIYDADSPVVTGLNLSSMTSADTVLWTNFVCSDSTSSVETVTITYFKNNNLVSSKSLLGMSGTIIDSISLSVTHFDMINVSIAAQDKAGNRSTAAESITVSNVPPDTPTNVLLFDTVPGGRFIHKPLLSLTYSYSDDEGDSVGTTVVYLSNTADFSSVSYTDTFVGTNVCLYTHTLNPGLYYIGLDIYDSFGAKTKIMVAIDSFVYDPIDTITFINTEQKISADSTSIDLMATAFSYYSQILPSYPLTLFITAPGETSIISLTSDEQGNFQYAYTIPKTPGIVEFVLRDDYFGVADTFGLQIVAGAPQQLYLYSDTDVLPADNYSTATLSVYCYDAYNNPISGYIVTFTSNIGILADTSVILDSGAAITTFITTYEGGIDTIKAAFGILEDSVEITLIPQPPKIKLTEPAIGSFIMNTDTRIYIEFTKPIDTTPLLGASANFYYLWPTETGIFNIQAVGTQSIALIASEKFIENAVLLIALDTAQIRDLGGNSLEYSLGEIYYRILCHNNKFISVSDTANKIAVEIETGVMDVPYFVKIENTSDSAALKLSAEYLCRGPFIANIGESFYDVSIVDSSDERITDFKKGLYLKYRYNDANQDGKIDGTTYNENYLKLYYYDIQENRWRVILNSSVNPIENIVQAKLNHLTNFTIFYYVQPRDISKNFTPRPNPFYPLSSNEKLKYAILWHKLTRPGRVRIRIFTAAGHLVKDFDWTDEPADMDERNMPRWDGRNNDGEIVISGVYYAVLEVEYNDGTKERGVQKILLLK